MFPLEGVGVDEQADDGDGVAEDLEEGDGVVPDEDGGDDEEDVLEDTCEGEDEGGGFADLWSFYISRCSTKSHHGMEDL